MSSTVQTRRSTTKQEDKDTNHRSLSERIRNICRKKSTSPTRPTTSPQRIYPSSESVSAPAEAPRMKAPSISWSFGRKKDKFAETTTKPKNDKTKIKDSRKAKKKGGSTLDISYPVLESEQQTVRQGQNILPKTPELTRNTPGRAPSTSNYETTTKGFRDFTTLDSPKLSHRVVVPNVDVPRPTSLTSNRSRSPSISRQDDSSPPLTSDSEVFPTVLGHYQGISSLVTSNPIMGSASKTTTDSDQWKKTSSSSLNKNETPVDVPKLRAPSMTFGSTSSRKENKLADLQPTMNGTYHSSPNINTVTPSNRRDSEISALKYPGLSAILEHHFRPTTLYPTERSPPVTRFDTSTTTIPDSDQPQQWSTNDSVQFASSVHQQDGYIRPITPQTFVDERSSSYLSLVQPVMYRSTTTIFTKAKEGYADGGVIQTWSIQENDWNNSNRKAFATLQRERQRGKLPWEIPTNGSSHSSRGYEQEEDNQYYKPFRPQTPYVNSDGSSHHYNLKRTDSYRGLGILICADTETRLNHRIRDIEPGSPGSRTGLRRNDRITHVNGINVENTDFNDVLILIKQGLQNNNLQFSVIHDSALI